MLHRLRPNRLVRRVIDLRCEELTSRGLRGVILDLDNTLTEWLSMEISPEVVTWVQGLRDAGLRACVVSNAATARRVRAVADRLGLPWVTRALKPLPWGLRRAMRIMDTAPGATAMVGDQLFTDIYGGNLLGLFTVLVEPISPREAWSTRYLQRPLERLVGRLPRLVEGDRPPARPRISP